MPFEYYYLFAMMRIKCFVDSGDSPAAILAFNDLIHMGIASGADRELAGDILHMGIPIIKHAPERASELQPAVQDWARTYGTVADDEIDAIADNGVHEAIKKLLSK